MFLTFLWHMLSHIHNYKTYTFMYIFLPVNTAKKRLKISPLLVGA